jgi:hypothetical protein
MAGYFRKHIPYYVDKTERLNAILEGYVKKNSKMPIEWTNEEKLIYAECQQAVKDCRKLYYIVDNAPIRIYTDASEYGIGAYLCQVLEDGSEVPIDFISRTLTKAERKWSTYEKEAFAIFFALRKWEAYLLDVKFTLFTDHKNLTYISKDPNAKVMRWRLAVQDYDFDIAYIPGEDNIIADAFSRLCPRTTEEDDESECQASASVAALSVNIQCFDEWKPVSADRTIESEKEHTAYFVEANNRRQFQETHQAVMCHALHSDYVGFIPPSRINIIQKCHNHIVGHWGVQKTIDMVKIMCDRDPELQDLQWNCMRRDVQTYIRRCDCCIKMREHQLTSHVQKYTTSEYGIMKCLSIDAIYMPKTTNGNKFILCVIDAFTRYVALYPIKDLTAEIAAKTMINHFCVYGIPEKITSDNSTQFDAEFKEMLSILETENYRTHPYSHQESGIVERANKEVIRHARNIAYELKQEKTWDEQILKVQAIMNEKVSEATGLSPNKIVFAGQIDLFAGRLYPQPSEVQRKSMSKYMKYQIEFQDLLMKEAGAQQQMRNAEHLANNDENEKIFQIGQYIVVKHESGQAPTKLSVRWHGPYRIIEVTNRPQGTVYTTYSPKDGKIADYHASFVQWHPCTDDTTAVKSLVLDDTEAYIVEEVLNHEIINVNGKDKLNLNIRWFGFKETSMTGMNISLKKNEKANGYLKAKGLKKFGLKDSTEDMEPKRKRVRFSASVPDK